jgi:alpha-N-arabinofuranosidase
MSEQFEPAAQAAPQLTISVDTERTIGTISRHIFGHFIEHLGRCIYGGVYDPGSPLADERGFRTDVLEAMQRLRVPNLRWPGGNFASAYHWEDGIGPKSARVPRFDLAWRALEPNTFGTDEFMAYADTLGAAPYLCINTGSGTLDEAARWVEYCNLPVERFPSRHALLRAEYGHPSPYGVKLWGIGNETYGSWQVGHAGAEAYARRCREFAYFMRAVDPSIQLVAVGADLPEWDETVIRLTGDTVDYISIHQYHGSDDYFATVGAPAYVEQRLALLAGAIDRAAPSLARETPLQIAMDEWNVCYAAWGTGEVLPAPRGGEYFELYEQVFALKDALFAAGVFHAMFRQCRHMGLANLAQMVNANGMLYTTPEGLLLSSIYHAFDLYANRSGPLALPTTLSARRGEVPAFTAEDWRYPGPDYVGLREPFRRFSLRDVPFIDAQATLSDDRSTVYLAVINYHPNEAISATLDFGARRPTGDVRLTELNGEDSHTPNTFQRPDVTQLKASTLPQAPGTYAFPPHSATVLEFRLG